jgi:O-antigen ligase
MGGRRLALPNLSGVLNKIRLETWFGKGSLFFYLCAVVMVASLALGGGAGRGLLSDAILQLLAIPLLLVSLWRICDVSLTRQMRLALWFCFAIAVLPLLQLIPLPPWLWTALPNRQPSVEVFDILGSAVPWMPISVSPKGTWLSALSLLAPLAVFLSTLLLPYRERRWLIVVVVAVGVLSVFIGFVQVAQGQSSALRFFEFTNRTEAVGFFANRNHFAALIYCLIVFVLGWTVYGSATARMPLNQKGKEKEYGYDTASIIALIGGFTLLVILLAGELMARSRAGLGLTIIALFGFFALGLANRSVGFGVANKLLIGVIIVVAIFSLQFALYRFMERIPDSLSSDRAVMASTTIGAARAYMPLGSGLGTFVPVYAMFEKPEDAQDTYVNRAHNEILEVWLETGVLGLVLTVLFVIWLVRRSIEIWRSPPAPGASQLDWSLIRAATIAPALLLAHSLVEFPLRTGAIMAVMAFACALLIEPPVGAECGEGVKRQAIPGRTRHSDRHGLEPALSSAKPASKPKPQVKTAPEPALSSASPAPKPNLQVKTSDAPSHSSSERWGADIEWPKEWSKAAKSPSPSGTGAPPRDQREPPAD